MNIEDLKLILMVAREESITKVSKITFRSNSTISRVIANAEKEYGVKLFERAKTKTYLTRDGKYFIEKIKSIVENDVSIKNYFLGNSYEKNNIKIGMTSSFAAQNLIEILNSQTSNMLYTIIINKNTSQLYYNLDEGNLDIICTNEFYDIYNHYEVIASFTNELSFYASEENIDCNKILQLADLERYKLIFPTIKSYFGLNLEKYLSKTKITLAPKLTTNDESLVFWMIQNQNYIGLLPKFSNEKTKSQRLVKIAIKDFTYEFATYFVCCKNNNKLNIKEMKKALKRYQLCQIKK